MFADARATQNPSGCAVIIPLEIGGGRGSRGWDGVDIGSTRFVGLFDQIRLRSSVFEKYSMTGRSRWHDTCKLFRAYIYRVCRLNGIAQMSHLGHLLGYLCFLQCK